MKKKSSAGKDLKAHGKARRDLSYLGGTSGNAPLDDITLRVIVSNIPKHRTTREELEDEKPERNVNNENKTRLAA